MGPICLKGQYIYCQERRGNRSSVMTSTRHVRATKKKKKDVGGSLHGHFNSQNGSL